MVQTYLDLLHAELSSRRLDLRDIRYTEEVAAKHKALVALCRELSLKATLEKLQPSPLPRGYRTTSRRRVKGKGSGFFLELHAAAGSPSLEPETHRAVFDCVAEVLRRPTMKLLGRDLNHIIVRGVADELAVIFNVRGLDAAKVRRLRTVVDELLGLPHPIRSAHVFLDPSGSDYYFESDRPKQQLSWKTLYGSDHLRLRLRDRTLRYHPTAFCQINGSLLPAMVDTVERLLEPTGNERLLDLYCGFGLFGLCLSDKVSSVLGLDWEGAAIESAKDNARRDPKARSLSYRAVSITAEAIAQLKPPREGASELVLLDPPRSGTAEGVVEALAERHPRRVVHVLCNIDRLEPELAQWRRCGYEPVTLAGLDMFPGTPHLEVMLKLEPRVGQKVSSAARRHRAGT